MKNVESRFLLFAATTFILSSCSKNDPVITGGTASNNNSAGNANIMSFQNPETPIPGTNMHYADPDYNCDQPSGNCLPPVVIEGGDRTAVNNGLYTNNLPAFFNGNNYLKYFPSNKITPEMLAYLRSGHAKSIRISTPTKNVFFIGGPNVTQQNAFLIVPIDK